MFRIIYRALTVPLLLLLGVGIFGGGFALGHYQNSPAAGGKTVDLGNFWETKRLIEQKSPQSVDSQALITGATKGLVEGLDDPYSAFLTKEEAKQLDQALSGTVEGIGVEIGEQNGQVTVIAPLPDSPAAKAGIVAGDQIGGVNGEPTAGKSLDDVAKQIRGQKGTTVKLEVKTGAAPPRLLELTRDTVKSPSVKLEYRGNPTVPGQAVALITLSRFGDDTKSELDKAVADIQAKQPRGIVLDMRSNPGGFLNGAIDVSSVFLKGGTVVKEKYARGKTDQQNATNDGRLSAYPLTVLVNKGTASAAEITAGALRDDRGIKLVGEKTFGKGSVQELENLRDGSVLKLTVAEYFTPKGTVVNKQGLKPDLEVPSDKPDEQLNTAITQLQ